MSLLLEQFESLLTTAEAVDALDSQILEWAVQGKFDTTNSDDAPVNLKRNKLKGTTKLAESDFTYKAPSKNWVWFRLGEVIEFQYGDGLPKKKRDESGQIPVYGSNGVVGYHSEPLVREQCIVVGRKGSAGAINLTQGPSWVIDTAFFIIPPDQIDVLYLNILLKSLELEKLGKGIKPGVNRNEAYKLVVAIPPPSEQKRIAAKVESLLTQTAAIKEHLIQAEVEQRKLNQSALAHLTGAESPAEFTERWGFIKDNFDLLYNHPENVTELKQTILQLAVQGKLVKGNPDDEPASELLKKIKAEKAQSVKEGKIKKSKPLPKIGKDEIPYELPPGWDWARFGTITINRDGERIPLSREVRAKRRGSYDYYGASGIIDHIDDYLFDKPLLLIGEDGANLVNRSTPIAFIARGKYWVNNHAHVLDAISFDILKYLEVFINAIDLKPYITGTAQPKMNQTKMNSILVALPPQAEQKRIYQQVEKLLRICDELEAGLVSARESHARVVRAVLSD